MLEGTTSPITVAGDFSANVWISAADDFHMSGLLGVGALGLAANLASDLGPEMWPDSYAIDD